MVGERFSEERRKRAAELLAERRGELLQRWRSSVAELLGESGPPPEVLGEGLETLVDTLLARLAGRQAEQELPDLTCWTLEQQQEQERSLKVGDAVQVLLRLKAVACELVQENVSEEPEASRMAHCVGREVEELLGEAAKLYQLCSEAELRTIQERTQEIFTAWEAEEELRVLQRPSEVVELAAQKLRQIFALAGCVVRLSQGEQQPPRELVSGKMIAVPLVREDPQFLTAQERERGGIIEVFERCRRRRQPCTVPKITAERVVNCSELLAQGVRSFACYPLLSRDRVLGTLLVHSEKEDAFQEHHRRLMTDFAGVLAGALEKTVQLEHSARQMSEEEVVARIGRSLLELPTREELLGGVVEALRAFRDYLEVSLFRVEEAPHQPGTGQCVLVAEAGQHRTYLPGDYVQPIGTGYVGLCAKSGETILATDLESDPRRYIAFEEEKLAKSELCVPVKKGGKVIGVLHFEAERQDAFPESDVRALEQLSTHIAVALENARMLEEQRHSRYELEQAHRQLSTIIRSTAVGITSIDTNGTYTHWSPSCERMLGYSAEEVVGKMKPADISAEPYDIQHSMMSALQKGHATAERQLRTKDGTVRIIQETRVPMWDENGNHIGFTSYLVDETERKQAELQLRQERDKLNLVVDAMGAGLGLFDADRRLQWANKTMMDWFGLGSSAPGMPCAEVFGCAPQHCESCPMTLALRSGTTGSRLVELTTPDGTWHCYQIVVSPAHYGQTRLLAVVMDITEQKRQTEQVSLINRLIKGVERTLELDKVLHLVLTCVTAGHALGFNRAFMFLLNEEKEWLEGQLAVGPASREEASRIWHDLSVEPHTLEELLDRATPGEGDDQLTGLIKEIRIPLENHTHVLVRTLTERRPIVVTDPAAEKSTSGQLIEKLALSEFVCAPLVTRDELLGVIVADNKYSGLRIDRGHVELLEMFCGQAALTIANAKAYRRIRVQMEQLRMAQQKLIESERLASIGQMAGHLAHEIRNPLATIGGFARYIASHTDQGSLIHRNANIIYDECIRLENILANVLDFSRPAKPEKRPVEINKLIENTVNQFKSVIDENAIKLNVTLHEAVGWIQADGRMIKQVVINLLKNAIEAVKDKSDAAIWLSTRPLENAVEMAVRDNGCGIDEEVRSQVFSPFFTTKVGGSGLGLSVCQRIVRQHEGQITLESIPGSGTTFTVTLPVSTGDDPEDNRSGES